MISGKTCDPLDENNDFIRGVESQTFLLLPFLAHCVLPSDGALGSYVPVHTGLTGGGDSLLTKPGDYTH